MKKLLLSLFTIVSLSAIAQKDLEIRFLLPVNGQEIEHNMPFDIAFSMKNLGPDTVFVSDSIVVGVLWDFSPIGASLANLTDPLAPGDSMFFTLEDIMVPVVVDTQALFCGFAEFVDTNIVDPFNNNLDCSVVSLKTTPTALTESQSLAQSVKAYPNPANSYFTLTMNASNASVEVIDITGKLIETAAVTMGEARLDVSNYKNGVYFYHIRNVAGSIEKSGKFTVSH